MLKVFHSFLYFGAVGTLGFLLDTSVLYAVLDLLGPYLGRAVSFSCSVIFTWYLNRLITFKFRTSRKSSIQELAHYFLLMLIGGAINIGTYSFLISYLTIVERAPILGVAIGSLAGLLVNFISSRFFLYSSPTQD